MSFNNARARVLTHTHTYTHTYTHIYIYMYIYQKERISNYYLVQELFWPLEFRIYIFRPLRMTDAILPGSPLRAK